MPRTGLPTTTEPSTTAAAAAATTQSLAEAAAADSPAVSTVHSTTASTKPATPKVEIEFKLKLQSDRFPIPCYANPCTEDDLIDSFFEEIEEAFFAYELDKPSIRGSRVEVHYEDRVLGEVNGAADEAGFGDLVDAVAQVGVGFSPPGDHGVERVGTAWTIDRGRQTWVATLLTKVFLRRIRLKSTE